jgi:hypothetical protein
MAEAHNTIVQWMQRPSSGLIQLREPDLDVDSVCRDDAGAH